MKISQCAVYFHVYSITAGSLVDDLLSEFQLQLSTALKLVRSIGVHDDCLLRPKVFLLFWVFSIKVT